MTITINNKQYTAQVEQTILDICLANHIFIPTLCKHADLSIQGKCRVCLVEVKGQGIVTSCSTPVEPGMIIKTNSKEVERARGVNLEMIYAEHIEKCSSCIQEHSCALKDYAAKYGLKLSRFKDRKGKLPIWHFGKKSSQEPKTKIKEIKKSLTSKDIGLRSQQAQLHADGYIQFDSSKCIDCIARTSPTSS